MKVKVAGAWEDVLTLGNAYELLTTQVVVGPDRFNGVSGSPAVASIGSSGNEWNGMQFDAASIEIIQGTFKLPSHWTTFNATLRWSQASTGSGDVVWNLKYGQGGSGDTLTMVTPSNVTVDAPAQYVIKETTLLSGIALSSTKMISLRLIRVANNASDTLAVDAAMLSLVLDKAS